MLIQQLTTQIAKAPEDASLYLKRAEMQRLSQHWHAAEPDYRKAAELDPGLAIVDLSFAAMWNDAGKPAKALPLLDRFLSREPASAEGYAERARSKRMLKQWAGAADDYAAAVERSTATDPELITNWADTLREGGNQAQALEVLDRAIARSGRISSLEMKALDLEESMKRHNAALRRIDTMLEQPGRKDSLLLRKTGILLAAERTQEARACLDLARKEFNTVPEARRLTPAGRELAAKIERLESSLATAAAPSGQPESPP